MEGSAGQSSKSRPDPKSLFIPFRTLVKGKVLGGIPQLYGDKKFYTLEDAQRFACDKRKFEIKTDRVFFFQFKYKGFIFRLLLSPIDLKTLFGEISDYAEKSGIKLKNTDSLRSYGYLNMRFSMIKSL